MSWLILGMVVFFAIHMVPVARGVRSTMIANLGEGPYKLVFSLVATIGLVLLIWGYGAARLETVQLWDPPNWTRHVAYLLMIPASILLAAAYIPSNLKRLAKHPMLVAVKLWAFAHLLSNGDSASLWLFGAFLAYAVVDRIAVKRREPEAVTVPVSGWTGDALAVAIGLAFYGVMLVWGHGALIGVPLLSV